MTANIPASFKALLFAFPLFVAIPLMAAEFHDGLDALKPEKWAEGSTHGNWYVQFTGALDGDGFVAIQQEAGTNVLVEKPATALSSTTHSSLVTSLTTFGDFEMTLEMKTLQQLKQSPNNWEVAWAVWHYTSNQSFYYFVLKPEGWEIGRRDLAYVQKAEEGKRPNDGQDILFTENGSFPIQTWYTVRIRQVGNTISVWVNGQKLGDFKDPAKIEDNIPDHKWPAKRALPYLDGAIGLYTEDALVQFRNIHAKSL